MIDEMDVVDVMSVQPTSEKRTYLQLSGSAAKLREGINDTRPKPAAIRYFSIFGSLFV